MGDSWHFLTAGLGSAEMEAASERICSKAMASGFFDSIEAVTNESLSNLCKRVSLTYPHIFNQQTRGYGYMTYKPDALKTAFEKYSGDRDGVVWMDAGCELFLTPLTRLRFKHFLRVAKRRGIACFEMGTPEVQYTKKLLFEKFPAISPDESGNQIQATWLIAYGPLGRKVIDEWLSIILDSEYNFNLDASPQGEDPTFVEHRYDQSIFSLVCKSNEIQPMKLRPTPGVGSRKTLLRAFMQPIWTARNRTGESTIPAIYRKMESN